MNPAQSPGNQSSPSPKLGKPRAAATHKHWRTLIGFGAFCIVASIAVVTAFSIDFGTRPAPVAESSMSHPPVNITGTIIVHSDTSDCQRKSFDNKTGQISEAPASCQHQAVDTKGMPIPTGTINTLNSISKSFK